MINSTSAELSKELLGAKILKVRDKERPKMQHVVPGETVSFLDDDALCAEHRALDGRAETDWAGSNDENLNKEKKHISLIWYFYNMQIYTNLLYIFMCFIFKFLIQCYWYFTKIGLDKQKLSKPKPKPKPETKLYS